MLLEFAIKPENNIPTLGGFRYWNSSGLYLMSFLTKGISANGEVRFAANVSGIVVSFEG